MLGMFGRAWDGDLGGHEGVCAVGLSGFVWVKGF